VNNKVPDTKYDHKRMMLDNAQCVSAIVACVAQDQHDVVLT